VPLLDHFHRPLKDDTPWSAFHQNWAVKMVDQFNGNRKTDKYKAQSARHFGAQIEADVSTLQRRDRGTLFDIVGDIEGGGVAPASQVYSPPAALISAEVEFDDPDIFEVKIFRGGGGWELVAAIELVSEANKDGEDTRRAFVVKCASYLQKGVSLVVVDAVTTYSANLHDELCDLIGTGGERLRWASPSGLSVVVYRATRLKPPASPPLKLDVFPYPIGLGEKLPTVPLWLAYDLAVPLELETTYQQACTSLLIG
jgi:hypothetical protein